MTSCLALAILVFLGSCSAQAVVPPAKPAPVRWEVERVDGTNVRYKSIGGNPAPRAINTGIHELKVLGMISDNDATPPYLVLTGRPCDNCLQDKGVYILRADGTGKNNQFVHPGKILETKTRQTVFEARAFFGKCLSGNDDAYVVFQKDRVDRRRGMQQSVLIVEPGKDHLDERLLERHLPKINFTLKRVKSRVCSEIEGRNRYMLTKPLDLMPRRSDDADDDDGDDETKENQTEQELAAPVAQ